MMNAEQIKGKWEQLKGIVKEQWARLTDDDLQMIAGQKDQLIGKLRERYGFAKERAEDEVDRLFESEECSSPKPDPYYSEHSERTGSEL